MVKGVGVESMQKKVKSNDLVILLKHNNSIAQAILRCWKRIAIREGPQPNSLQNQSLR